MKPLLYDQLESMSLELNDWMQTFLEEGHTQRGALLSAHDKIKERYEIDAYEEFNDWIEEGSAGPYG